MRRESNGSARTLCHGTLVAVPNAREVTCADQKQRQYSGRICDGSKPSRMALLGLACHFNGGHDRMQCVGQDEAKHRGIRRGSRQLSAGRNRSLPARPIRGSVRVFDRRTLVLPDIRWLGRVPGRTSRACRIPIAYSNGSASDETARRVLRISPSAAAHPPARASPRISS